MTSTRLQSAPRNWLNIGLAIASLTLLVYYVAQINIISAQTWNLRDANEQLRVLRDERNTLIAQQAALDDRQALTALADKQGLVPADNVVYLMQDHSVAAR